MSVTRGYSFSNTETVTAAKLHALVDDATVSGIIDADIASDADINSSKINFDLSSYVTLAGNQSISGAKTFQATTNFAGGVFSTPLADSNLAQIATADKVHGSSLTGLASVPSGAGLLPRANQALQDIDALLPSQGSANGKFLTSNGSAASWTAAPASGGWEYLLSGSISLTPNTTVDHAYTFESGYLYKFIISGTTLATNECYGALGIRFSGANFASQQLLFTSTVGNTHTSSAAADGAFFGDRLFCGTLAGANGGGVASEVSIMCYRNGTTYYSTSAMAATHNFYTNTAVNSGEDLFQQRWLVRSQYSAYPTSIGLSWATNGSVNYTQTVTGRYTLMRQKV
jgi:hypothetical protein